MTQTNISMKQNHRLSAKGKGVAEGWNGSLGFTDVTGIYRMANNRVLLYRRENAPRLVPVLSEWAGEGGPPEVTLPRRAGLGEDGGLPSPLAVWKPHVRPLDPRLCGPS